MPVGAAECLFVTVVECLAQIVPGCCLGVARNGQCERLADIAHVHRECVRVAVFRKPVIDQARGCLRLHVSGLRTQIGDVYLVQRATPGNHEIVAQVGEELAQCR